MGKNKKKLKKKERWNSRYNYTEEQFLNSVCSSCKICGEGPKLATLCYEVMYKQDADAFMNEALPELLALKGFWEEGPSYLDEADRFYKVFCEPGICGQPKDVRDDCFHLSECLTDFKEQLDANIASLAPSEQDDAEFFENSWEGANNMQKYYPPAPVKSKKQLRKEARKAEQEKRNKFPPAKVVKKPKQLPTCFFFCRTPGKWAKEMNAGNNI